MRFLAIPIAAMLFLPSWVQADEMPGYVKGDSFGQTRVMKAASCPYGTNLTKRECDRIRQIDRSRAARKRIREKSYVVVERDDRRGRCAASPIRAKGAQRITTAWARSSAIEAWGREVRYDLGETYLGWSRAKKLGGDDGTPGITCNSSSVGGTLKRCEAKAIPCQGN